jgi:hypothetical protein
MLLIKRIIRKFIQEVKEKYPDLNLNYEYDKEHRYHNIYHDNQTIDIKDKEFRNYVGRLICKYFYSKHCYNVVFGYDFEKFPITNDD